jgi:MoaA/NifB/PqqE/SkfB family radical SAM enzyme
MFQKTDGTIKALAMLYNRFVKPNLQRKRYRKITKLFIGIAKYLLFKKPYILIVETGTVCNLTCPTCPTPREIVAGSRSVKNMELDSFRKIITNAHKSFSAVLLYWSNEPLLNRNIADMVRFCNTLNLHTFISTNVMLLSEETGRGLIGAGLDELLVCLDGFSAKTYEPFRRGAKFETVKRNIENVCRIKKEMKAVNPWVEIQYIETKQNSEEIASCREWARGAGVDGFRVQPLYITRHLNDFEKLRNEFYSAKDWAEANEKNSREHICKNADSTVCVLVNGQLTVCCYDIKGTFSFGNLLEDSFEDIAKGEKYSGIKRKGARRELSICRKC